MENTREKRLDWRVLKINLETLNQKIVYQSFDMQDALDYCKKLNEKKQITKRYGIT